MPQVRSIRASSDQAPNGPGSVYSVLADVSISLRRRALKVNDTEKIRLDKTLQHLERNVRNDQFRRGQVISRISKKLKERRALHKVLRENFRANEMTKSMPERLNDTFTKEQRCAYDMKIFHGGFSQKNLQPEIDKVLNAWDPETIERKRRDKRKKELRRQYQIFPVDRKKSLTTIFKSHNDFQLERLRPETDPAVRERLAKAKYDIFGGMEDLEEEEKQETPRKPKPGKVSSVKKLPPISRLLKVPSMESEVVIENCADGKVGLPKNENIITQMRKAKHEPITPPTKILNKDKNKTKDLIPKEKDSDNKPTSGGQHDEKGSAKKKLPVIMAKPIHREASNLALKAREE